MNNKFKEVNIGQYIYNRIKELDIEKQRILNFVKIKESDLDIIFKSANIDCEMLLSFSKLLEYDFFRLYSQHLILYSPPSKNLNRNKKSSLPRFRKNIYTREIIDFVLEMIRLEKKSKQQVIDEYRIPKTTLYKWIDKYN